MPPDRPSPKGSPKQSSSPTLLPSAELKEFPKTGQQENSEHIAAGMEIERPRSALHSGDFRKDSTSSNEGSTSLPMATSPPTSWHTELPPLFTGPRSFDSSRPPSGSKSAFNSSLASFISMPPTSPLHHASSTLDPESPPLERKRSNSPEMDNRRHTFSTQSFQTFRSPAFSPTSTPSKPIPTTRREPSMPYQAHQPRRSASGASQFYPGFTPQTPRLRPRGSSISSEASPLQHAPMVGSYEESILRGRMSTLPSRPLDFVAQIGVLGKGKCKGSLRCPPHVIVPFPAVFYSYSSGNGRISNDQPSPYVGLIDIEHSVPHYEEKEGEGRRRRRFATPPGDLDDLFLPLDSQVGTSAENRFQALRIKKENLKRRSQSPRAPPGGCYRIPQQGQLQIVIKNPNKTAVKLFLVPYDLSDMEPGHKTFIRQRSYSAGPIIDMPLSSRKNFGTERPEAALSNAEDLRDRPTLRYLIHINICCPAKGRYFLYKSIRVVFANRVPDGKESLRNEVQLPEPRYSTYKAARESTSSHSSTTSHQTSMAAAMGISDKASERSMRQFFFGSDNLDAIDGLEREVPRPYENLSSPFIVPARVKPIPFTFPGLEPLVSRPSSRDQMDVDRPPGTSPGQMPHMTGMGEKLPESVLQAEADRVAKEGEEWGRNSRRRDW
jgi:Domain of unknown function (DUF4210)/Chromosome segregation during meiosis